MMGPRSRLQGCIGGRFDRPVGTLGKWPHARYVMIRTGCQP